MASCSHKQSSLSANERREIIKEIKKTLDNYYSDIEKDGLLAEFKYLDSSADFYWVPPGFVSAIPFDSVSRILRENAGLFTSIVNSWDTLQIIPISPIIATYSGRLHSKMVDKKNTTFDVRLVESGVMIKKDNKWKLLSGQTSIVN